MVALRWGEPGPLGEVARSREKALGTFLTLGRGLGWFRDHPNEQRRQLSLLCGPRQKLLEEGLPVPPAPAGAHLVYRTPSPKSLGPVHPLAGHAVTQRVHCLWLWSGLDREGSLFCPPGEPRCVDRLPRGETHE